MKECPILFNSSMVRAILDGSKTQTRRAIKPQPTDEWNGDKFGNPKPCHYGTIGDQLWVKETWRTWESLDHVKPSNLENGVIIDYAAGGNSVGAFLVCDVSKKWRSSLFMQKRFSRIQLEITDIRIERLNDISKDDAVAEGIKQHKLMLIKLFEHKNMSDINAYMNLWESINGIGSWAKNPFVWCVSFKVIKP